MTASGNSAASAPEVPWRAASGALRRFFTYGILMEPFHHHGLELDHVGEATTRGRLFQVGEAFPALVWRVPDPDPGEQLPLVHGVVWEAPSAWQLHAALQTFDAIEGYTEHDEGRSMYLRRKCETSLGPAWCYVWNGGMRWLHPIPSGRWVRSVRPR